MPLIPINHANLASVSKTYDPTKPIYMLNLWKYRETASYAPEAAALASNPCTGREAAARYRAAVHPLLPPNASVFFMSTALTEVSAPEGESWDDMIVVKHEDLEGFRKMVESKEYVKTAQPHRLAALEDFRLIMTDKVEV